MSQFQDKIKTVPAMAILVEIKPVIIVMDNVLKLHKLLDLSKVDYCAGRPNEELPSISYSSEIYSMLLGSKFKFVVESDKNPDPDNLLLESGHHHCGNLKWFTPHYMLNLDNFLFDVKLSKVSSTKTIKFMRLAYPELVKLLEDNVWKLQQIAGGVLSRKQICLLNVQQIELPGFTFYQAK